ncbi:MAG: sugar ABC transporter permease [Anaerolineae bacterium]|jgi:multiple sugar transport system permease protein
MQSNATFENATLENPSSVGRLRKKKRDLTPYWFLLPGLIVLVVVFLLPIGFAFVISFFRFDLNVADFGFKFLGLKNYFYIFQDRLLIDSIKWTFQFTFIVVLVELALGMVFALLLNSPILGKARNVLRGVFLVPIMFSGVLTAWMWRLIFDASYGPANHLVTLLGLERVPWGASAWSAKVMIIAADIWLSTPFIMLILLAGLQNIPTEILEAASIDGANAWRKFISITLPFLKFPIMVVLVIRTMDALRIFDQIFVLTNGGPGSATTTIMFYNYRFAFSYFQMGRAAAISFSFMVVIFIISYIYSRVLRREVEY